MVLDSLEGDGISDVLLQSLWTKDELGYSPSVWVPDSIVYKFGQPTVWYFTGVDGKLKKKNKHNLASVNIKIEEVFNKSATCDILGYYISETSEQQGAVKTSIEYLDRKGLHDFLYNRWKENNGILQRFVEPKGMYNAMIRAIWSPKVCLLERRQNARQLHDRRYGLYERAVTYEGPDHFCEAAPLRGSMLPNLIQKMCETMEAHVAEVSFRKNRIVRLVANLKVDARDRIWLLWTSSIRLAAERDHTSSSIDAAATDVARSAVNIDTIVQLPAHVQLVDKVNHSSNDAPEPLTNVACTSCGCTSKSNQFHPVQYKAIIAHFEQLVGILKIDAAHNAGKLKWPPDPVVVAAAGGVGFGFVKEQNTIKEIDLVVPPVIRRAHPRLTVPVYKKYRRDPLFLYKSVSLCEGCFLAYAELSTMPKSSHASHLPGTIGYDKHDRAPIPKPPAKATLPAKKKMPPATRELPPKDHVRDPWIRTEAPILPPSITAASEVAFFRDAYATSSSSQQLPKGHPLTHMVTMHSMLKLASKTTSNNNGKARKKHRKS
ncbi:hypothetical protein CTAYLR_007334, partial [Chrysophaeum taylorii]